MSYRRFTGYNRRTLDTVRFEAQTVFGVQEVTFAADGTEGLLIVQLAGPAAIVATTDPILLAEWALYQLRNGNEVFAIQPTALESLLPTATGDRFQLRFAENLGSQSGFWKLLIPSETSLLRGQNGSRVGGWVDPQTVAPPAPELPYALTLSSMGSVFVNAWQINSASVTGANTIEVDTGDPANSPFSDLTASGWSLSGPTGVTTVADLGGGILELQTGSPVAAGVMVAIPSNGGPASAGGWRAAASFAVAS